MAKILLIEESALLSSIIIKLLKEHKEFTYTIVTSYHESEGLLKEEKFDYAITDLIFSDAQDGQVIALLNRHKVAPIIFTQAIDTEFIETFEESNIIDYILKERYENVKLVVKRLVQLEQNREKKVLLVGHSITYRYYIANLLKMHNITPLEASSPSEALSVVEKNPSLDLIILDECNSDDQTLSFIRTLRRRYQEDGYPLVSLTKSDDTLLRSLQFKEGVNDFLIKPFSRDEFYLRIYNFLGVEMTPSCR